MIFSKEQGRELAKILSAETGRIVSFIEFDGKRLHFAIEERWTIKIVDREGNTLKEAERLFPPIGGYPKYYQMACYPVQLTNGDAKFLINTNRTQLEHERFENAE